MSNLFLHRRFVRDHGALLASDLDDLALMQARYALAQRYLELAPELAKDFQRGGPAQVARDCRDYLVSVAELA